MQKINIKILNAIESVAEITIALAELGFDVETTATGKQATIQATRIHEYELPGERVTKH